ncbi:MAG: sigma-70 family RNA polymerase sigma factor [Clostridia bacterium]|nr:sigma-70 family RNA polymerase sigma factor [Clostridia bacterium]
MNRENAERIITEYLKPVFGFALKRCKSIHDAEDLSQDIILKAYRALLLRDDIEDAGKFIWTIAHNALANYYRDASKNALGISLDMLAEAEDPTDLFSDDTDGETVKRLQSEIAYLSKLQRRIVIAYYYENRKQTDIADELGIPLGTVKWHLFEAKKELKRGMEKMRESNELKFNPVKFSYIGLNGSVGKRSPGEILKSALSQNICYDVRNDVKTVAQIADDLGVSPVFVEGEIESLEEYGLLTKKKDGYIVNFLIEEPTQELLIAQDKMYKKAAEVFANELFDELTASGILDGPDIICNHTDEELTMQSSSRGDRNFMLWTLIPFIAALSGEKLIDDKIAFEEVASMRPDGGHNIIHASVMPTVMNLPPDYVYMNNWFGPAWNSFDKNVLWQIHSEWSSNDASVVMMYPEESRRVLSLFSCEDEGGVLSKEDYAWLAERGLIKFCEKDGCIRSSWQFVWLADTKIKDRLLSIGDKIKEKHKAEFDALKAPYVKKALEALPTHLKKLKEYEMQFIFYSDGWFLLHCITTLLSNGKLKLPPAEQKKSLMTLIYPQ